MHEKLFILNLEDSANDAELNEAALAAAGIDFEMLRVDSREKFTAALDQEGIDIILADYSLPMFDGLAALAMAGERCPLVPFIFVTGTMGEEIAIEALKSGATDYVIKDRLGRLPAAVKRALRESEERRQRQQAEEALRQSEARHRNILKTAMDGFWRVDREGRLLEVNEAYCRMSGFSEPELLAMSIADLEALETPADTAAHLQDVISRGEHRFETRHRRKDGSLYDIEICVQFSPEESGHLIAFLRDITERKRTESLLEKRLELSAYAAGHQVAEVLQKTLDLTEEITGSAIGFYHYLDEENQSILLQQWSSRTQREFCRAVGYPRHYSLDKAGVWADCVKDRRPVIHNDYASLPHRKGLPEGHAPVARELVVPIFRKEKIVAVLGVGNKPEEYTEKDIETVVFFADYAWDVAERKRAEEDAAHLLREWQTTFDATRDSIFILDKEQRILRANKEAGRVFQRPAEELAGNHCWKIVHGTTQPVPGCPILRARESLRRESMEIAIGEGWFLVTADPVLDATGQYVGAVHIISDITERKRAEAEREKLQTQLLQAQKMESVGRLAGGVAHDFNNMLGVVLGYVVMLLEEVDQEHPFHRKLLAIKRAAERSANLTRQLLAFARKQIVAPRVLDLNETVEGMLKLLRQLIGEDIDLAWLPKAHAWPVKMDPSQIDQVLANLCVNARDAISGVGRITIETGNVVFDEAYCAGHADSVPGEFAMLAVSDNGCGMDRETLAKIFEPFFTTKEVGTGTGLGLATVYGIIKQNNGFINVYSEPGEGSTFKVYLPRHRDQVAEVRREEAAAPARLGRETVLLVEDDPELLTMGLTMLEKLGYTVLAAATPEKALRLAAGHEGSIDLLVTDVVMPEMNGRDLAMRLRSSRPDLKCLFMSGYTANVIAHHGVLDEDIHFIEKPFFMKEFSDKLRDVLESG